MLSTIYHIRASRLGSRRMPCLNFLLGLDWHRHPLIANHCIARKFGGLVACLTTAKILLIIGMAIPLYTIPPYLMIDHNYTNISGYTVV